MRDTIRCTYNKIYASMSLFFLMLVSGAYASTELKHNVASSGSDYIRLVDIAPDQLTFIAFMLITVSLTLIVEHKYCIIRNNRYLRRF